MPGSKTNPLADCLVTEWRCRTIDVGVISFHPVHAVFFSLFYSTVYNTIPSVVFSTVQLFVVIFGATSAIRAG